MKISNLVFATRLCARAMPRYSQASPSKYLPKEGRRSADRRIQRKPHLAMRRALSSFPLPPARRRSEGARSPFGAPPRHFAEVLPSTRPRPRFLESPDPNGRTLSGTSAASTSRSDHAPDGSMPRPPARVVTNRARGNRTRSASRGSSLETPFDERNSCIVTGTVTDVNRNVTTRFHASLRAQRSNPGRLAGRPSRTGLLRRFAPRNDECPLTRLPRSSRL